MEDTQTGDGDVVPQSSKERRSWRGKLAIGCLCLMIFLVSFLIIGSVIGSSYWGAQLEDELALLSPDEPKSSVEVGTLLYPPIPDSDNAAPHWLAAAEACGEGYSPIEDVSHPTAEEWQAAREWIAERSAVDGEIRLALARPAARFEHDFAAGFEADYDWVTDLRYVARFLQTKVRLAQHDRDSEAAVQCLEQLAGLAEHSGDFALLPYLINIAISGIVLVNLGETLSLGLSEDQLQRVEQVLRRRSSASLRRALVGERAIMLDGYTLIADGKGMNLLEFTGYLDGDRAAFLSMFREALAILDQPFPQWKAAGEALEARVRAAATTGLFRKLITGLLFPGVSMCIQRQVRAEAQGAAAHAAVAVELTRIRTGELPETLIPERVDPWTGRPLIYLKEASGYKIYATGPDGVDNGGNLVSPSSDISGDQDWGIEVRFPPPIRRHTSRRDPLRHRKHA